MPEISVVIGAKNAELTVKDCIESVLASTHSDFEVIVVDDGSTDGTNEIISRFSEKDGRVRVFRHPVTRGLASALNLGIAQSDSKYVARIDADDLVFPERLSSQAKFLDRQSSFAILGSGRLKMNFDGKPKGYVSPNCPTSVIPWQINWGVPFTHPSVMMRRTIFSSEGLRYNEDLQVAQDYELWTKILKNARGANDYRPHIWFRVHPGQATSARKELVEVTSLKVCAQQLADALNYSPDASIVALQAKVFGAEDYSLEPHKTREAVEFRQEVCRQFILRGGENIGSMKAGFGLDLLRLMRFASFRRQTSWLISDRFRRDCLMQGMPLAAWEYGMRRYWRGRSKGQSPSLAGEADK